MSAPGHQSKTKPLERDVRFDTRKTILKTLGDRPLTAAEVSQISGLPSLGCASSMRAMAEERILARLKPKAPGLPCTYRVRV